MSAEPAASLATVLHELRQLRAEHAQLREIVAPLAVRQRTRAQQAKKTGVHRSTVWRREQRARAKLALLAAPATPFLRVL